MLNGAEYEWGRGEVTWSGMSAGREGMVFEPEKTDVQFKWTEKRQARFGRLKDPMVDNVSLKDYEPTWETC